MINKLSRSKQLNHALPFLLLLVLPAAIAIAGANMLVNCAAAYRLGYSAATWPTTTCTITDSSIRDGYGKYGNRFRAHVSYNFLVDGKSYSNNVIYAGYPPTSEGNALKQSREFPIGETATIWYNPSDPNDAVLKTGVGWSIHVLMAVSLLFTTVGTWCFYLGCKKLRSTA